jgi:hypothetical protein
MCCVWCGVQGIKSHPWYTKELPPFLQDALDGMAAEQVGIDVVGKCCVLCVVCNQAILWLKVPSPQLV